MRVVKRIPQRLAATLLASCLLSGCASVIAWKVNHPTLIELPKTNVFAPFQKRLCHSNMLCRDFYLIDEESLANFNEEEISVTLEGQNSASPQTLVFSKAAAMKASRTHPKGLLILMGGYAQPDEQMLMQALLMHQAGWQVVIPVDLNPKSFDFGFNRVDSVAHFFDNQRLRGRSAAGPVVQVGLSMGSLAAVQSCQRQAEIDGCVFVAPLGDFTRTLEKSIRNMPRWYHTLIDENDIESASQLLVQRSGYEQSAFNFVDRVHQIQKPALVLMSRQDELAEEGMLSATFDKQTEVTLLDGFSHAQMIAPNADVLNAIEAWQSRVKPAPQQQLTESL